MPRQGRQPAHQRGHILRAAFAEIAKQSVEFAARQGRAFDQPQILVAAFAGQQGQLDAPGAGHGGELVAAIAPPVIAAEDTNKDDLRMRRDAVDPEVDRHRMPEVAQRGEPHRGQVVRLRVPGGGEARKVAVGEGQRHNVRRRLTQVDRLDEVVERGGRCGQDVHGGVVPVSLPVFSRWPAGSAPSGRSPPAGERRSSPAVQARS